MKTGLTLTQLAQEIERQATVKKDFIAPVPAVAMVLTEEPVKQAPPAQSDDFSRLMQQPVVRAPSVALRLGIGSAFNEFNINMVAHNQLAEYAGIPLAYYKRMLAEKPDLLAQNINTWIADNKSDKRMVRTLDGTVRAFMSDKYRPLDNRDLAEAILPALLERNLIIMSCQITDTRLYIKAVDPTITKDVPTGHKMGDGSSTVFDTLSPAIIVSNSEVGHGALTIETGVYTKACTNMALFGAAMRKHHTGARADVSDDVYELLTNETKQLTDAAVWSQTRDLVGAAFDRVKFEALANKIGAAANDRIDVASMDVVEVVNNFGKRFDLNEGEKKGVLASLIEGGDFSRYGVHSAVTAYSAKVEDYDRATQLERLGGKVIELPKNDWQRLLQKAA